MIFESKATVIHQDPATDASAAPIQRQETCAIAQVRRVAAMLDLDPDAFAPGQPLPRGWQFLFMAADTRRSALRSDGFPGLGVAMPDLGLPRLMLGGRKVAFHADIPIGSTLTRTSAVHSVRQKDTASGPMAVVEVLHTLQVVGASEPALVESQTYLLLSEQRAGPAGARAQAEPLPQAAHQRTVVPDDTLLFQYSALGFNSHRIHLDRDHARGREGFPDLVVNGGLITLLLTEFLRGELGGQPKALATRHVAPLYCNRPATLSAERAGAGWVLTAHDERNHLAVEMTVELT